MEMADSSRNIAVYRRDAECLRAEYFLAMVKLASMRLWLRTYESTA